MRFQCFAVPTSKFPRNIREMNGICVEKTLKNIPHIHSWFNHLLINICRAYLTYKKDLKENRGTSLGTLGKRIFFW